MADPSQQAAAAAAAAYGASTASAATSSGAPPNPQSSSSGPSSGDRCAQCQAIGVPLLTPDEPVGMAPTPNSSNKPRYVLSFKKHEYDSTLSLFACAGLTNMA